MANRILSLEASRWLTQFFVIVFLTLGSTASWAQAPAAEPKPLTAAQLEQLVAPIALHPDALLSQIMMASTYPLEVVEANRWVKANSKLTGKALTDALLKQHWDPSVQSLGEFPQVLQMMNDQLSWMQQLGDAFLAQQAELLDAVQRLRAKAVAEKTLVTTDKLKVKTQTVTPSTGSKRTVIIVEPADPEVIYIPAYNPVIVYGRWPYAAYPPYYWYPPGYVARRAFWFGVGIAAGRALWGGYNWGRRSVNININRYNNFNRTRITSSRWSHNPVHRRGVSYRSTKVSARYGSGKSARSTKARESFRGRADAGRRDLATKRPGGDKRPGAGKRPGGDKRPGVGKGPDRRPKKGTKPTARKKPTRKKSAAGKRPKSTASKRRSKPSKRPSAYRGMGRGKQVKRHSSRGSRSRGHSRSRGGGRGRSRGGGGRSRGGGGRRR